MITYNENISSGTALKTTASGAFFLIEKEARECGPLQFLRELVVNGLETNESYRRNNPQDKNFKAEVRVEQNSFWLSEYDINKLTVVDTGEGMTEEHAAKYLGYIFDTSKVSLDGKRINHGVGARISTLTRNPFGVEYISITKESSCADEPYAIKFRIRPNPNKTQFEFVQFNDVDNEEFVRIPLTINGKRNPEIQKTLFAAKHGTQVTLLGNSFDDDTLKQPNGYQGLMGSDTDAHWISHTLNSVFYTIPDNQTVHAFKMNNQTTKQGTYYKVDGSKSILDQISTASGTIGLKNAKAHIWVIDLPYRDGALQKIRDDYSNRYPFLYPTIQNFGLFGIIHDGEMHNTRFHKATKNNDFKEDIKKNNSKLMQLLQGCGITAGYELVQILFEPENLDIVPNISRTMLTVSNPKKDALENIEDYLEDWQKELSEKLPDFVLNHIENHIKSDKEFEKKLEKRYKENLFLFESKAAISKEGEENSASRSKTDLSDFDGNSNEKPNKKGNSKKPKQLSLRPPNERKVLTKPKNSPSNPPKYEWISHKDEGKEEFEGKAGFYSPGGLITLNKDYAGLIYAMNKVREEFLIESVKDDKLALDDFEREFKDQYMMEMATACKGAFDYHTIHNDGWNREQISQLGSHESVSAIAYSCLLAVKVNMSKIMHTKPRLWKYRKKQVTESEVT